MCRHAYRLSTAAAIGAALVIVPGAYVLLGVAVARALGLEVGSAAWLACVLWWPTPLCVLFFTRAGFLRWQHK